MVALLEIYKIAIISVYFFNLKLKKSSIICLQGPLLTVTCFVHIFI